MSEPLRDPAGILLARVASGSEIWTTEAIEHEGLLWLVPDWYADDSKGWMWPVRMLSLETVHHQQGDFQDHQVQVLEPLPSDWNVPGPARATETAKRTRVLEAPRLLFSLPATH